MIRFFYQGNPLALFVTDTISLYIPLSPTTGACPNVAFHKDMMSRISLGSTTNETGDRSGFPPDVGPLYLGFHQRQPDDKIYPVSCDTCGAKGWPTAGVNRWFLCCVSQALGLSAPSSNGTNGDD